MDRVTIEICCGSAEDAVRSAEGKADRVELCANLFQGGLTPTPGMLHTVKRHSNITVMAMIRPREGGFCYNDIEFETALFDAKLLLGNGADGLVFGFLDEGGKIDIERTKRLLALAEGKPCCFHRAFDVVSDWKEAIDLLSELGVSRILTSGQRPNVLTALDTVREMINYAAGRIEIMPGAGIHAEDVVHVAKQTGASSIHLTMHKEAYDHSTHNNRSIYYGGALYPPEDRYFVTDRQAVQNLMDSL